MCGWRNLAEDQSSTLQWRHHHGADEMSINRTKGLRYDHTYGASKHDGEFGLVYWGQQQPGSYQGGEMMMMKSVFWWGKPEYPEETTDLRQVTDA